MKRNAKIIILLFEIFVCCCLAVACVVQYRDTKPVKMSISDWKSDYIQYDNGWYVDETILNTSGQVDLLYGPYVELKRGTYSVMVDYDTDYEQECVMHAEEQDAYIKSGTNKLVRNQKSITYRVTLTESVQDLEVIVRYNGNGSLRIHNIEIRTDSFGMRRTFACVVLLFVILDFCLYFREYIQRNRNIIFVAAGMTFLISLPLFMRGITEGHDISVHFMRIEGIAQELRNGNLPVRISSLWLDGHGYPISIYYGDLLLYIPAILRIIGFPVVTAYKIFVFLINAGTVICSYVCFKQIFSKVEIACVVSLAYVTAGYRLVDVYVRAAVGEYCAMMFLPVIVLALYNIYMKEDSGDSARKQERKNALLLAFGMTGLIGTHILSTQMVVFVLVLVCVIIWKATIRKNTLFTYFLAVIETLLINLYFIIPFVDYYLNVRVNINGTVNDEIKKIQDAGTYIGQYFAFFQSAFGLDSDKINERLGLTPGIVLMSALLLALVLWLNQKASKELKFLTLLSGSMLFVASDLFPWNHLAANYKFGAFFSQVQFPWRYISIAVVFLSLLLGYLFEYYSEVGEKAILEKMYSFTIGTCMFISFFFVSDYSNHANMVNYYDTAEVNTYAVGGGEYLRRDTEWVLYPNEISQENMLEASLLSRKGYAMELYCETADKKGTVEVPVFHYKGYRVKDEYGKEYNITDGKYNVVKFSVPANFSGKIMVDFVEPWYWRAGEAISIVFVLYLCIRGAFGFQKISMKKEDAKK